MVELKQKIMDSRQVNETTADEYINLLKRLNGDKSFANLGFLKKRDVIVAKLSEYAESTRKTALATIVSVLSLVKDKTTYKAIYNFYYERMMDAASKAKEVDTSVKSEKQRANWMTWPEVEKKRDEYATAAAPALKAKVMTPQQWTTLLTSVILSLYTYLPPRRNQDYQDMVVVKQVKPDADKSKNYYETSTQKFIFNKFKTAKSHGTQVIELKDTPLVGVLTAFLKVHPQRKSPEFPLLVAADGSSFGSVNSITRLLNKAFGKQVGTSMLRHIYLSDKYKVDEMKKDAEGMGHSLAQQREYLKSEK